MKERNYTKVCNFKTLFIFLAIIVFQFYKMSDPLRDYRALFKITYGTNITPHKPTLVSLINKHDDFWKDYKFYFFSDSIQYHDKQHIEALKNAIIVDLTMVMPIMKYIHKAIETDETMIEKEEILKSKVGNIDTYEFPIIRYITHGKATSNDIWNFIRNILYEEQFKTIKKEVVDLKEKKKNLYRCITAKNKRISKLNEQLKSIRNNIRYVINE